LPSGNPFLTSLELEFAYFSGRAWFVGREVGGAGAILRFERVRPRRAGRFQPLKSCEITPRFLDRAIRALKRWKYDIVGMDEVCRRAVVMPERRRFVCLTFDGTYKDVITSAYPVLSRHGVPFTIYVPTAFPDGVGEAWWLALEAIIAREDRVSLMIDRVERHFTIRAVADKHELYDYLESWMRSLAPPDLSAAINDLCMRYSVDLARLSREAVKRICVFSAIAVSSGPDWFSRDYRWASVFVRNEPKQGGFFRSADRWRARKVFSGYPQYPATPNCNDRPCRSRLLKEWFEQ